MKTPFRLPAFGRLACLAVAGLLLAGCSSHGDKADRPENPFKTATTGPGGSKPPLSDRELRAQADELYRRARNALDNSDYSAAITRYDNLIARYPFSDYSTQAELEKIYSQYKSFQTDDAVTAADRFLRAHPRHPHADYVQYIKGLADFERDDTILDSITPGSAKRDVGNQLRSFEDFALLLQRYPHSRYYGDARRRMLYSRNRIATHQLSVAQFYITRGAYVAAAKRATDIITEYPGAPSTIEALKILQLSYAKLNLNQEASDTATLIAMNSDEVTWTDAPKPQLIIRDVPDPARRRTKPKTAAAAPAPPSAAEAAPPAAAAAAPAAAAPAAAAPAAAAPAAAATADQQQAAAAQPQQKPGLFTRFAHLFSPLDTSKPENQHTFVIGSGAGSAASTATAGAAATAGTTAAAGAAAGTAAASSAGADAAAPAAAQTTNIGLKLKYGGGDDTAAAAASGTVAPAGTQQQQPAAGTNPQQPAAAPEKKGFFTWFAGLFSVFDSDKRASAPANPAPATAPPADNSAPRDTR